MFLACSQHRLASLTLIQFAQKFDVICLNFRAHIETAGQLITIVPAGCLAEDNFIFFAVVSSGALNVSMIGSVVATCDPPYSTGHMLPAPSGAPRTACSLFFQ
eukprot:COSAG03_NODE_2047_length_3188_cov_27.232761_2_plen_103_part_00